MILCHNSKAGKLFLKISFWKVFSEIRPAVNVRSIPHKCRPLKLLLQTNALPPIVVCLTCSIVLNSYFSGFDSAKLEIFISIYNKLDEEELKLSLFYQ